MRRCRFRLFAACLILFMPGSAFSTEPKPVSQPRPVAEQGPVTYEVEPAARKALREDGYISGKLGHLVKTAGTYDYYTVLNDPAVLSELRALLGDELPHLFKNMGTLGPIILYPSELWLTGGRPHQTDVEGALVSVDVVSGTVEAMIFSHGKTTVYSRARTYWELHAATQIWLHVPEFNDLLKQLPKGNIEYVR